MKPINVYSLIPAKSSASYFYRLQTVLETASVLGLPVRSLVDTNDANVSPQDRVKMFCEADLILMYHPVGDVAINNFRGIQSFLPSKRDGEWKYPPSIVIESDDNLFNVSPLNQAFRTLGIRDMDGNQIPLGHHIGVVQDGERKVLWKDGENGFSLAKNRQTLASYRKILEIADQVQCSTRYVAESVKKEVVPRRLRIFPNLMRFDHYPQVNIVQEPRIKILWQGGIAHYEDFYPLRQALGNITAKYPQVHWIIWGAQYPWVNELIPPHRYTFMDWCAYAEYKLRLVTVDHDISLAPLSPNVFNNCRSAIKFYEASVLRKPAATLAQRTGPYEDEIIDGETALLFKDADEFEAKLSLLIEDVKLRRTLAANAKDWVHENRDAMKEVPKIVQSWEVLREERKLEQPHCTEAEWAKIEQEAAAEERGEMSDEPVPALNESG